MKEDSKGREPRFTDLGLSPDLIEILNRLKFTIPTPIQYQAIPLGLAGKDVVGVAQTGTGKTLSFFLPMLQNLKKKDGMGLIVVPTRELAYQVSGEIDKVGNRLGFRTVILVGGANIAHQVRAMRKKPHIIVATPGRLNDHIERKTVRLDRVKVVVLDEADRMLDMGFAPQINQILKSVPRERQTMLFSATMPPAVAKIGHGYMKDPVTVKVESDGLSAKNVDQGVYFVESSNKFRLLQDLLREYKKGPVLVFCRTKHGTKKMAMVLNREGFPSEELHSNRSLAQRRRALDNFKRGKSRVMVATDVAARGIDVKEIELVINYDLPDQHEDYVHRIGRTGRAGHKGKAVSFVMPDQYRDMQQIQALVGKEIKILEAPGTIGAAEIGKIAHRYSKPSKKGGRGGRGGRRPGINRGRSGNRGGSRRPSGGGRPRSSGGGGGGARRSGGGGGGARRSGGGGNRGRRTGGGGGRRK
ncbi:MAG TPA: DEAD/DEAH box helicase [Patescibacteria group bacterium]|nr:DEAD/DEAH box helicase [Patescibacteria group bacterium]